MWFYPLTIKFVWGFFIIFDTMDIITDNYKDWLNLARTFVGDDLAPDVVQEAYLRIHNKKEVNRSYMYLTIRSISFDILKLKSKIHKEELTDFQDSEDETEKKECYNIILNKIQKEIESWNWYDQMLFKIYKDTPMSLRDIAKETDISLVSIFNTIKNCKKILKIKFQKDYNNYLLGNYEKIR